MTITFNQLPPDLVRAVFDFLTTPQLALLQRVCNFWKRQINSSDHYFWKKECRSSGVPLPPHSPNYKFYALPLRSRLTIRAPTITIRYKIPPNQQIRWGTGVPEPFIDIVVSNQACKIIDFPDALPLRLFFNPDGTYKTDNQTVRLMYLGRPVVLNCQPLGNTPFGDLLADMVHRTPTTDVSPKEFTNAQELAARCEGLWISSDADYCLPKATNKFNLV